MIFYKKTKQIQAITFDLDDTLYENTSIIVKAENALLTLIHEHYPIAKSVGKNFWRTQQKKHILSNPSLKNDMGELRRLSLKSGFEELGLSGDRLHKATTHCFEYFYFQRSNFNLNENIHSLLNILSSKLPLVAITNGNVDLEQIGINKYFTASFKASIDMPMKPNTTMFHAAQSYLNIPHENILHVGDNLSKDVYGAIKAGYQTAWYAEDRAMNLNSEKAKILPHVQLCDLTELLELIEV